MIGLVLVAHGHLAKELIVAMEHIVGPQSKVEAICVSSDDKLLEYERDITKAIERVRAKSGVLVLTDMFGGTPFNLAISNLNRSDLEVVAGVNLPMLVKFATCRSNCSLQECVDKIEHAGRKYISIVSRSHSGCEIK